MQRAWKAGRRGISGMFPLRLKRWRFNGQGVFAPSQSTLPPGDQGAVAHLRCRSCLGIRISENSSLFSSTPGGPYPGGGTQPSSRPVIQGALPSHGNDPPWSATINIYRGPIPLDRASGTLLARGGRGPLGPWDLSPRPDRPPGGGAIRSAPAPAHWLADELGGYSVHVLPQERDGAASREGDRRPQSIARRGPRTPRPARPAEDGPVRQPAGLSGAIGEVRP